MCPKIWKYRHLSIRWCSHDVSKHTLTKSTDPKNPPNNTLFFTEVLRRELWAWMKRRKKREFIACGSRNTSKKLILCKNFAKIKNVCKRFPNLIQALFINSMLTTISEPLNNPGRNWCRFGFLNLWHLYQIEMGNAPSCPYQPSGVQKQHFFHDKKSVTFQTQHTGVKTRTCWKVPSRFWRFLKKKFVDKSERILGLWRAIR